MGRSNFTDAEHEKMARIFFSLTDIGAPALAAYSFAIDAILMDREGA